MGAWWDFHVFSERFELGVQAVGDSPLASASGVVDR